MSEQHPVENLFDLLEQVRPYPAGVVAPWGRISGASFFPGGWGLWGTAADHPLPKMPIGGVMVLGHNFDCEDGFAYSLAHEGENLKGPTWRTLRRVLTQAGIALEACFFTNAYMGLKAGSEPTGKFPGAQDAAFVSRCQWFLGEQLRVQQPRLLLTLGKEAPLVLTPLSPALQQAWAGVRTLSEMDAQGSGLVGPIQFTEMPYPTVVVALTHPANRVPNVARRQYRGLVGDTAEQVLLRDALELAHLQVVHE